MRPSSSTMPSCCPRQNWPRPDRAGRRPGPHRGGQAPLAHEPALNALTTTLSRQHPPIQLAPMTPREINEALARAGVPGTQVPALIAGHRRHPAAGVLGAVGAGVGCRSGPGRVRRVERAAAPAGRAPARHVAAVLAEPRTGARRHRRRPATARRRRGRADGPGPRQWPAVRVAASAVIDTLHRSLTRLVGAARHRETEVAGRCARRSNPPRCQPNWR